MDFTNDTFFKVNIDSIPDGVRELMEAMPARAKAAVPEDLLCGVKNIVMTGCGDSQCAAMAAKEAFEEMTGLRVDTPNCLDLARHYHANRFGAEGETLVFVISTSGRVSRCVEAARRAKRNGAITVAVTANRDADLGQNCDYMLDVTLGEIKVNSAFGANNYATCPGSRNYVGSALALQSFAAEMGVVIGAISKEQRDAFYSDVMAVNDEWEKALSQLNKRISSEAEVWNKCEAFEALGSGSEYASAWFAQAKVFESIAAFAKCENFEDWHHVDYFLRDRNNGMLLFCMKNNEAFSRCREVEIQLARQEYTYFVFTDAEENAFVNPDRVVHIPSCGRNYVSAVFEAIPGCIVFDYLQRIRGTGYYCGDLMDSWFPIEKLMLRNSEMKEV